jgi:NhaP-type Na+/H+ or K+/H+ antiporter
MQESLNGTRDIDVCNATWVFLDSLLFVCLFDSLVGWLVGWFVRWLVGWFQHDYSSWTALH